MEIGVVLGVIVFFVIEIVWNVIEWLLIGEGFEIEVDVVIVVGGEVVGIKI